MSENKKIMKINEIKTQFFNNTNNVNKPLTRLIGTREICSLILRMNEEISVLNLQFKKRNSNEFDSLDEMGKFFEDKQSIRVHLRKVR